MFSLIYWKLKKNLKRAIRVLRRWSLKVEKVSPMSDVELAEIREEMIRFLESIGFKVVKKGDV